MKRGSESPVSSWVDNKRHCTEENETTLEGCSESMGGERDEAMEGTSTSYGCTTNNRFDILKIPIAETSTLRLQTTNTKPPSITVHKNRAEVELLLKDLSGFVLSNLKYGTRIFPNDIGHHKAIIELLEGIRPTVEFFSQAPPEKKMKRFVLYGLNTHDISDIMSDLDKYGVQPEKIVPMKVKKARYHDHQTYLVYYKFNSNITLDIVQQAKYVRHTKVSWANYIINGDGATVCGRCSNYGHSASYCNLSPRCGVCAGHHSTSNCELIQKRREEKKERIDDRHLKCPNCGGNHTAKFARCPRRMEYIENRRPPPSPPRRTFADAPAPQMNAWNYPELQQRVNRNTQSPINNSFQLPNHLNQSVPNQNRNLQPPINNSFQTPTHLNQSTPTQNPNNNPEKFNAKQIMEIFNRVITCIDKCNSKSEQLQVMMEIISNYYI